jgi:hypothetical protein
MLAEAWAGDSPALARRRLKTLLRRLEHNGEYGAASLRKGAAETLTVLKLELRPRCAAS